VKRRSTQDGVRDAVRDARVEGAAALLAALGLLVLYGTLSQHEDWRFSGAPWWAWLLLAVPEAALLGALIVSALGGVRPGRHRNLVLGLLVLLAGATLAGTGILMWVLATADVTAGQLLLGALVVWTTNLIAFGLLFWELDGGGPLRRVTEGRHFPDFQFPQDQNPDLARPGWRPRLIDYLYLSLTNSLAFSPTDAMPLSRWAKVLMGIESLVSTALLLLVIARAVNVLTT
jgi:hypothetical protein